MWGGKKEEEAKIRKRIEQEQTQKRKKAQQLTNHRLQVQKRVHKHW